VLAVTEDGTPDTTEFAVDALPEPEAPPPDVATPEPSHRT
jgi:hypothetical protein